MSNIEIGTDSISVEAKDTISVSTDNSIASVTTPTTPVVEMIPDEYVISSGGMYRSNNTNSVPSWLATAIQTEVEAGTSDFSGIIADLTSLVNTLQSGVNQNITSTNTLDGRVDSLSTEVVSVREDSTAAILDVRNTYATEEFAQSTATDAVAAIHDGYNDTSAWILGVTQAYADSISANSNSINALNSTIVGDGGLVATADAVTALNTEVGITDGVPDGTGLMQSVSILQSQVDGVVETHLGDPSPVDAVTKAPLSTVSPYQEWLSADTTNGNTAERDLHTGDTYIEYELDGTVKDYVNSYRFAKGTISDTSTDADGYGWFLITDSTAAEALAKAIEANDLADGKRRVFIDTPYPPYEQGDIWLVSDNLTGVPSLTPTVNEGEILRTSTNRLASESYNATDWVRATSYLDSNTLVSEYELYVDTNLSYNVKIFSNNGNLFRNGIVDTTLTANIFKGTEDITANFTAAKFSWERTSANSTSDSVWNLGKQGVGNSIAVTDADVFGKAVFTCIINLT